MALTDNLVAYYKLDDSSGNATDSVGSRPLTNNNTVAYSSALINNGASFGNPNTNKYLAYTGDTYGISGGACSISFWVKNLVETSGGNSTFGFVELGDNTFNFVDFIVIYQYNSGTPQITFDRLRGGVTDQTVSYTITMGTSAFHHIVLTYDGVTLKGYVDNNTPVTLSASGNGTTSAFNGLYIGQSPRFSTFTPSIIDEVAIWSRAISSSEVTSIYNSAGGIQYPFSYTLSATTASFLLTGINISFKWIVGTLIAGVGSFILTGINVTLKIAGFSFPTKSSNSFSSPQKSSNTFHSQTKSSSSFNYKTKS